MAIMGNDGEPAQDCQLVKGPPGVFLLQRDGLNRSDLPTMLEGERLKVDARPTLG